LVIDDCSTDGSLPYLQTFQDQRIRLYLNTVNKGLFKNLNFLIGESSGKLIKLWSQDDVMYPDCLEKTISFHNRHSDIGFSYSGRDIIDEAGQIISLQITDTTPEIISRTLHSRIAFFTGSIAGNIANVTLKKKVMNEVGLFDETMNISADFDMWVRIAEKYSIGFIKEHLIQLRDHSKQLSRQQNSYLDHLKEDVRVYQYLLSYANESEKKEGKLLLRNHKLLFYYTLMMHAFVKGSFTSGQIFLKGLRKLDNIWVLTFYFIKNRILFRKKYTNIHLDNTEIISKYRN
jgi:glycosyltransferase involved in cell wall biosynthesis